MLAVGLATALVVRTPRLALLASEGQLPYDSWRRRTQLVQHIDVFVDHCRRTGDLPELAAWFERLAVAIHHRWSGAGTPPAPAVPGVLGRSQVISR